MAGFEPVGDDPSPKALRATLASLLSQFERRGKTIQEMVLGHDVSREKSSRAIDELSRARREIASLKSKLKKEASRSRESMEDAASRAKTGEAEAKRLRRENAALKQRLSHSEHRVKAKEAVIQRMQSKLTAEVSRRNAERERDRDMFRELHRRGPRPSSAADRKAVDLIGAFETQKEKMQSELQFLRGEVQRLSERAPRQGESHPAQRSRGRVEHASCG